MGYELWTSPITGYRRVGTRIEDIRNLFMNRITVNSIFEPLKSCPHSADARYFKEELDRRDFDLAGVVNKEKHQEILGYVEANDLTEGIIEDHIKGFNSSNLISDSTAIVELIKKLKTRDQLFVLSGTKTNGIVTVSDLNKPPVRIYFFSLITMLELHMTYWITEFYGKNEWVDHLSEGRLKKAKEVFEEKKKLNSEIDLINCIQFADKKTLISNNDKLREKLELGSKTKTERSFRYAESLRNNLAHSETNLAGSEGWGRIFDTVEWTESLLIKSDSFLESKAIDAANNFSGELI